MSSSDSNERMSFHGIDAAMGRTLKANKALIMAALPAGLDAFYDHISQFPETKAFFKSREHMMHAKSMQLKHWDLITDGDFGAAYVTSVTRIGEVHNKIGLEPKWYIGGYSFLLCALIAAVAAKKPAGLFNANAATDIVALQQALTKTVMVDTDFAIAVYLDAGKRERVEAMKGLADRFESTVGGIVDHVGESARGLNATAVELSSMSQQVLVQSANVASASEQASVNVQTVAAASEELVSSIAEISRQVSDAARIALRATEDAESTAKQIEELSRAAQNIGEVVQIINNIASQTNLLALNATIEATRAGESGRGFAVVATEVKQLANETAKATQTISGQIAEIQASTQESVSAIKQITGVIAQLNEVASAIASSVEQQGAATHEISHNIQQVSSGTAEVSSNIVGVTKTATDTSEASGFVLNSSRDLSQQAEKLKDEVLAFLTHARSA